MVGEAYGPIDPVRGVVRRESARWWWAPMVAGVAWLIIGWAVLRADVTSLTTVGVLIGFVFLGLAITETGLAWLLHGGWRLLHAVLAGVFLLGAGWAFIRPVNTFFALASVLGLLLLVQGMSYIGQGIGLRGISAYWGFSLFSGILITALGLWVSTSDRVWTLAARSAFILVWVGFMAIFRGIQDVAVGFTMLHASRQESQPQQLSGETGSTDGYAAVPQQREGSFRPKTPVQPAG
jgi:uncharacterized membrane protein HdeD (DUF308 family)